MKFFMAGTGNLNESAQLLLDPRSHDRVVRDEVIVRAALDPNLAMIAAIQALRSEQEPPKVAVPA